MTRPTNRVYKIINNENKFSTGGYDPTFTRLGKFWSNLNSLKSHLAQYFKHNYARPYENTDAMIVEYELVEVTRYTPREFYEMEKK
jgi:hypothetical protein